MNDKVTRRRIRTSHFSTIVSIALVLFMIGLVGFIVVHANELSKHIKENISVSIILKRNTAAHDIQRIKKSLDAKLYVKSCQHVDQQEAAKAFQEELGEDFLSYLGYNPLLPSIDVHLQADYANNDSIQIIREEILAQPEVQEVYYQKSLVDAVNENLQKITLLLIGGALLMLVVAVVLIGNSIRLSIYAKRLLIRSMQLVGATRGFVRRPFLWKGIEQGLYGAAVACAMLVGMIYWMYDYMPELLAISNRESIMLVLGIVVITGMLITLMSTLFSVNKYLRMSPKNLF